MDPLAGFSRDFETQRTYLVAQSPVHARLLELGRSAVGGLRPVLA